MIDERQQELASLYALDLLEGAERTAFENALRRDGELARLVRELRESAADFALSAPQQQPSPELKARIMDRISAADAPTRSNVVPFSRSVFAAWAIAAGFAVGCGWLGQLYLGSRTENLELRDREMLASMEVRGAQLSLDAERILAERQLADTEKQMGELKEQIAKSNEQLSEREQRIAAMGQRIDALTGASAAVSKLLVEAREQIATLNEKLQTQGDLAQFKIATLASMAGNSPQALAVAVWNPKSQEGVLSVAHLPALASDKDYQLWLIDPAYPAPVDGGVFTVDPATGDARINFKPNQRVNNAAKFAVSLERKGGVKKAEGPIVLIGD